jgi:hypothetical protein
MSALVGPAAWTAHELLSYMLAAFGCSISPLLHVLTLACLGVTVFAAMRARRMVPDFIATTSVLLNAVFAFAIVLEWLPSLVLAPCR